jgi:hypothetical protein
MSPQAHVVSLSNLGTGAAVERFDVELQRVLANIMDVNTKSGAERNITLKVTIAPSEDRATAGVSIECTSKLAPYAPHPTMMFIKQGKNSVTAYEADVEQADMFEVEEKETNVVNLKERKVV